MVILGRGLEVTGQGIDAGGQQSDLNFRGAGIGCGALIVLNDLRFLRGGDGHRDYSNEKRAFYPCGNDFLKRFMGLVTARGLTSISD